MTQEQDTGLDQLTTILSGTNPHSLYLPTPAPAPAPESTEQEYLLSWLIERFQEDLSAWGWEKR